MAIDDALMEHLADLAHPVVHIDFGTAQAQRRFTAHRDEMFALTTVETAVFDRAYLLGIPAPEHLVHEAIIVRIFPSKKPWNFQYYPIFQLVARTWHALGVATKSPQIHIDLNGIC